MPKSTVTTLPLRAYVAEFIATCTLTLAVSLGLSLYVGLVPFLAALTVGLFVYSIGGISGAHINPAVTVGLWSIGKMKANDAILYIAFQLLGAACAMLLTMLLGDAVVPTPVENTPIVGAAEALGTFILVFGISSVAHKRASVGASGVVVGGSLLLGILLATSHSNGILNPAVAMGVYSLSPMYVLGPLVGGIAGAWVGRYIHEEVRPGSPRRVTFWPFRA